MLADREQSRDGARIVRVRLSPTRVAAVLVAIAVLLDLASGANLIVSHVFDVGKAGVLDVGDEASLGTWFSTMLLAAASVLLLLIGALRWNQHDRYAVNWLALSAILGLMSLDEVAAIHEHVGRVVHHVLPTDGLLYYSWVIPALVAVAVVAVVNIRFLRSLPTPTARLFMLAAVVFVVGAVGFEMLSGLTDDEGTAYAVLTTIEELLEMLGVIVLLYALLDVIVGHRGVVEVHLPNAQPGAKDSSTS